MQGYNHSNAVSRSHTVEEHSNNRDRTDTCKQPPAEIVRFLLLVNHVSVVIPNTNRAQQLDRQIDSYILKYRMPSQPMTGLRMNGYCLVKYEIYKCPKTIQR